MKRFLLIALSTLPLLLCAQVLSPELKTKLDALIAGAAANQSFSGNVLIGQGNEITYEKAVGKADIANNLPNNSSTSFQIGSITKMFTEILILQLAREHKLELTDPLEKYLDGFSKEAGANITIQQLMQHTSGMGDYTQREDFMQMHQSIQSLNDILPLIRRDPLLFKPGADKQYSNSGYVVLSAIIEKITGHDYRTVLNERIFGPLKMEHSGFNAFTKDIPGKAKGYLSNQLGPIQDNLSLHVVGAGDGGIYSSTGDMWKFMLSFINDNRLLSNEYKLRLLNTPLFPVIYTSWDDFLQKGRLSLAGGAPGISALIGFNMEKKYSIIVLSNFDERTAEEMGQRISAILNDRQPAPFRLPPAKFIYSLLKEKGPQYFLDNYKKELTEANIPLDDDMNLLYAGEQLLADRNADAAIALYTVYTKEFPNIIVAWNDMGDAYLLKGDKEQAKKCFTQALKLRPANERAKRGLQNL